VKTETKTGGKTSEKKDREKCLAMVQMEQGSIKRRFANRKTTDTIKVILSITKEAIGE